VKEGGASETVDPPVFIIPDGDSDAVKGSAAAAAGSSAASGGSFLQMANAMQSMIRMMSLRIMYPVWYIKMLEGLSLATLNFKPAFIFEWLGINMSMSEDVEVDLDADSNVRIFLIDTMDAYYSVNFIFIFALMFVMIVTALAQVIVYIILTIALRIRFWISLQRMKRKRRQMVLSGKAKSMTVTVVLMTPHIWWKLWIFFRALYYGFLVSAVYNVVLYLGMHMWFFAGDRPMWETVLACSFFVAYMALMTLWALPAVRSRPKATTARGRYMRKWDMALYEFKDQYWWAQLVHVAVQVADAVVVLLGLAEILTAEMQLCLVLGFSTIRTLFFTLCVPAPDKKTNFVHALNSTVDTLLLLLLFSMLGKERTSGWNQYCTLIVAISQQALIALNMVIAIMELIVKTIGFCIYLVRLIAGTLPKEVHVPDEDEGVDAKKKQLPFLEPIAQNAFLKHATQTEMQSIVPKPQPLGALRKINPLSVALLQATRHPPQPRMVHVAQAAREHRMSGPTSAGSAAVTPAVIASQTQPHDDPEEEGMLSMSVRHFLAALRTSPASTRRTTGAGLRRLHSSSSSIHSKDTDSTE
jgi:hypothetical protein